MTDNARENGEQETIVESPEMDDEAIFREFGELEKASDPDKSRTEAAGEPEEEDRDNGDGNNPKDGDAKEDGTPEDPGSQKPEDTADDWEGVPEPVRARLEALQERNNKLEERIRTEVGRVAKTQRRISELTKIIQSEGKPEDGTPDRKRLEELKQDYPEMYEAVAPIDQALQKMTEKERARVEDAKRELSELYESNSRQVDEYHPDRHELLKNHGDLFQHWVTHPQQAVAIREAAFANADKITDPQAAAWVIEQFKGWMGQRQQASQQPPATNPTQQSQPSDRRKRQMAGATAPRASNRTPTVSGIPEEGDPEQMWKAFAEMERRQGQ